MEVLVGQCFHSIQGNYDYTICPFDNVTQVCTGDHVRGSMLDDNLS